MKCCGMRRGGKDREGGGASSGQELMVNLAVFVLLVDIGATYPSCGALRGAGKLMELAGKSP